ncbi:hypothetical protein EC988_005315 [Linderina pennispora]|nr:hypothetical protein EC988_005315 [Linderina pennispora]
MRALALGADTNGSMHVPGTDGAAVEMTLLQAALFGASQISSVRAHGAAAERSTVTHTEIAEVLVLNGAATTAADVKGLTCLHIACMLGSLSITRYLLDKGADPQMPFDGKQPLDLLPADEPGMQDLKAVLEVAIRKVQSRGWLDMSAEPSSGPGNRSLRRMSSYSHSKSAVSSDSPDRSGKADGSVFSQAARKFTQTLSPAAMGRVSVSTERPSLLELNESAQNASGWLASFVPGRARRARRLTHGIRELSSKLAGAKLPAMKVEPLSTKSLADAKRVSLPPLLSPSHPDARISSDSHSLHQQSLTAPATREDVGELPPVPAMRHVYATPSNVSLPTVASESSIDDAVIVDIESTVEAHKPVISAVTLSTSAVTPRNGASEYDASASEASPASTPSHPPLPVGLPPLPSLPSSHRKPGLSRSATVAVSRSRSNLNSDTASISREEKSALSRSSSIRALRPQAHNGWKSIKNDFEGLAVVSSPKSAASAKPDAKPDAKPVLQDKSLTTHPSTERFVRKAPVLKRRNRNPGAASSSDDVTGDDARLAAKQTGDGKRLFKLISKPSKITFNGIFSRSEKKSSHF